MKKRKGASQPLPLSARMQMQREAELTIMRQGVTKECMELYYRGAGVILNRLFGFGEKKILEFQTALTELMGEIRNEKAEVDYEYALDKLERAYLQIVKSDNL